MIGIFEEWEERLLFCKKIWEIKDIWDEIEDPSYMFDERRDMQEEVTEVENKFKGDDERLPCFFL